MKQHRVVLIVGLLVPLIACTSGGEPSLEASQIGTASAEPTSSAISPSPSADRSAEAEPSPESSATASASASDGPGVVDIIGFVFEPEALTVSAGSEVTFTNLDAFSHTATAGSATSPTPDAFDSGPLRQDESFAFLFEEAGEFAYYCAIHPNMEGTIVVEP